MSFPRYDEYKDSGVAWVGDVPSHWTVGRLKHVLAEMGSGGTPDTDDATMWADADEEGAAWVAIGDMSTVDTVRTTAKRVTRKALASTRLRLWPKGTLVFSMYASLGHVAVLGVDAAINQALLALRPRECSQGFLRHWLSHMQPRLVEQASSNTQDNLNAEKVRGLPVAYPDYDEQDRIAAFLDRETAKIDALVEEQKRLIELLKEKRQAVISQAVTKGLDPNVPMKDSGVAWLGKMPAHWRVKRLKDHGALVGGAGFPHEYQGREDEAIPFYKVASLDADSDGRYMSSTQNTISPETAKALRAALVPSGAILWAKIGAALMLNRRRITTVPCCIDNNMTAYLPDREVSTGWAYYWTSLLDFAQFANPGAVPSLSEGYQATLPLLVPPPREQAEIAAHIDAETAAMDSLSAEASAGVELLLERRSALISAAVTGKIDVRGGDDLAASWAEATADIAAGRFVVESSQAHLARIRALISRDG